MTREGNRQVEGFRMVLPVKEGTRIRQAGMVALDADGYAVEAAKKEGLKIVGLSEQNTTGTEDTVIVSTGGFVFANDGTIAVTDIGKECYAADSTTVTLTETGASAAGKVIGVEDGYVTVLMQV